MLLIAITLVLGNAPALEQLEAAQLIERANAAHGALTLKEPMWRKVTGSRTHAGTAHAFTYTSAPPDRLRAEEIWSEGGREVKQVVVLNGKQAWENIDGATRECTPEEFTVLVEMFAQGRVTSIGHVDANRDRLTRLPPQRVGNDICVGIRVELKDHPAVELHFAKDTLLLQKVVSKKKGPDGKVYDYSEIRTDYKRFSGQLTATKTVRQVGDLPPFEEKIDSVEFVPIDKTTKLFDKP